MYLTRSSEAPWTLARLARSSRADVVYANSLWSSMTIRYLVARRLGLAPRVPLVIAARGELSPGALALKRTKKAVFLRAARATGLLKGVVWQASTRLEEDEFRAALGSGEDIHVARDVAVPHAPDVAAEPKRAGRARFVFVSRISPKKNLLRAVQLLQLVGGDVSLDVYGPKEDEVYWRECEALAARPGGPTRVRYAGVSAPLDVPGIFARYDFFLFPTLGENFGHVIVEALGAGCPVVLSDTTPWKDLEARGCGWALPLLEDERWAAVLQACVEMDAVEHAGMRCAAVSAANAYADPRGAIAEHVSMFRAVCGAPR
jgi:glycosyltransferase involved in cell wall biosynthesis